MRKNLIRNIGISVGIFTLAIAGSRILQILDVQKYSTTVFIFAVFLISLCTDGYVYGVLSAFAGMLMVNYAFTYPLLQWDFIATENVISAFIMIIIAILTGTLTTKLKAHEAIKAESERERMRANLLRAISHDLRTPLTTIYGASSALREKGDSLSKEQQDTILKSIQEDSKWLIKMVENLLSITRLNDGRLKFKFTDQLLDEVIAEALRHISRKHDDYKIVTDCEELVLARMDVRLIMQVLINLVDNAIKYTPPGSVILIRGRKTDGRAQISVEDNGPGIPEEMKPHVFEMFYTGKKAIADSHRSMGLGLALCRSIVEAHNGTLMLTEHEPHGCNFTFTLPLSEVTLHE